MEKIINEETDTKLCITCNKWRGIESFLPTLDNPHGQVNCKACRTKLNKKRIKCNHCKRYIDQQLGENNG